MNNQLRIFLIMEMISFSSCNEKFDYSPYTINFNPENQNVNQKNINKLNTREKDDTISIAFTGDTHRFYDELEKFVIKVNEDPSIDFVIHVGDLADFGVAKQYIWGNSMLAQLEIPYFVVAGNHDLITNGEVAYKEMYGPLNFSFICDSVKFVFINTNSREFKFKEVPDINWLNGQLHPDSDFLRAVCIFHVPPMDADFSKALEEDFRKTLARYDNVLFCSHGHLHGYELYKPYDDSISYVNVFGVEHKKFNKIRILNNRYEIETIEL